ncbi:MAG TPA: aldo/keto reductase [Sphingomonas sp.]|uniref:aldo/keto reductase n=1 Tax=Sphingomonas sp. TaxID=28214 RepID=UPI002CDD56C6|nr:aldo/keto reductase [Sphingomonas sp.]HMI20495.1 aldo/keto reductase [Sphingomonas sp.]
MLGRTGIDVSPICMGCMNSGEPGNAINPWAIGYEDVKRLVKWALDRSINFFDTANVYSKGTSEEYGGRTRERLNG